MIEIMEEYKSGTSVADVCREHGISTSTLYAWKLRLGCSGRTELTALQRLRKENYRLRRQIAEMHVETDKLKGVIRRHRLDSQGRSRARGGF